MTSVTACIPDNTAYRRAEAECPRCGYDLSAIPPSWQELCPVTGQCSECGLELSWGEVLADDVPRPAWLVERSAEEGPRLGQIVTTLLALRNPARFWTQVRLRHRPNVGALLTMIATAALLVYFTALAWVLLQNFRLIPRARFNATILFFQVLWPWARSTNWYFWITIIAPALAPMVFLALRHTLESSRVRAAHVFRAGVYGFVGVAAIMLLCRLARVSILLINPRLNRPAWSDPWSVLQAAGFRSSWAMLLALGWLGVFWWYAVTRYLRLPHPGAVYTCLMLISILGAMAVVQEWPGSNFEWYRVSLRQAFLW